MSLLRQIEEKGDGGCDVLQKVDSRCHPSGWAQRTHHMRLLIVECCSQDELEDEILRCIAKKMSLMEFELFACIFFISIGTGEQWNATGRLVIDFARPAQGSSGHS